MNPYDKSGQKPWSKLQKELYLIIDKNLNLQIHCTAYRMKNMWDTGREMARYFITLDKEIIFDYPKEFLDKQLSKNCNFSTSDNHTVKVLYPYYTEMSVISKFFREYIDTPKSELLTAPFTNDEWGLADILRASDRRIGKNRLSELYDKTESESVKMIIRKRLEK